MKLNHDLNQRAFVNANQIDWLPSPLPGVERHMLERDGGEVVKRATTVVRYAPSSAFSPHVHGGGEEFLVLEGVFSDETGDFPKGAYVRNPPGSKHQPSSEHGCTILVKLAQINPKDHAFVRINTLDDSLWMPGQAGERRLDLHQSPWEKVEMLTWQPGTSLQEEYFPQGAEYFVVEGAFHDGEGHYEKGCWLRLPPGGSQRIHTEIGAKVYRKTHHLLLN